MSLGMARALDGLDDLHNEAQNFLKTYIKDPKGASEEARATFDRMIFNGAVKVRLKADRSPFDFNYSLKGVRRQDRLKTLLTKRRSEYRYNSAYFLESWRLEPLWHHDGLLGASTEEDVPTSLLIPGDNLTHLVDLGLFDAPLPHEVEDLVALMLPEGGFLKGLASYAKDLLQQGNRIPTPVKDLEVRRWSSFSTYHLNLMGYIFVWDQFARELSVLTTRHGEPLGKVKAPSLQEIDLKEGVLACF